MGAAENARSRMCSLNSPNATVSWANQPSVVTPPRHFKLLALGASRQGRART